MGSPATAFHRRILEALLGLKAGEGAERLVTALSEARVDLNPHQIEAAAFALDSLSHGGCLLADEVGLGKTIEAGLVLAQLRAEGAKRLLVLCPATLRSQWQGELSDKFEMPASIVDGRVPRTPNPFESEVPVIASIPFGASRAQEIAAIPWDLVVVDEAHRLRNAYRPTHKTGRALRHALRDRPKLLLTATPLQNDLLELYGLISLLDERILGPEAEFRVRYAPESGLGEDAAADLKARLAPLVQRTLRRQVKEYVRFTQRRSLVEDFAPSPEEQALYERVSDYLRRSDAIAVDPLRRSLLVLVCRKLLASSSFAIAPTLRKLADGLEARTAVEPEELLHYAEEVEEWGAGDARPDERPAVAREVAELREYAAMAERIATNAKGDALLRALDRIFTVARAHGWPEKAVVFTESRRTQEYLFRLLSENGHAGTISALSGDSGNAEQRATLIAEFRDRTRILLSTEAGAEGLNLQFCNVVVNYDLPWNPQRVEQRIGRCHRYGQTRDVLVINFLNRKNAADARLYELLEQKLHLFDGVFGASDEILGALESGVDFERRVLDIYQSCRSEAEIDAAFAALRAELETRIDQRMTQARSLLMDRFDGDVRRRLRLTGERMREAVERRNRDALALQRAGGESGADEPVSYLGLEASALPERLRHLAGAQGWWFVYRFGLSGPRSEERLVHLVLIKEGARFEPLSLESAELFLTLPAHEDSRRPESIPVSQAQERALTRARDTVVHRAERVSEAELDVTRERLDRYAEECLAGPRRGLDVARTKWEAARQALAASPREERALPRAAAQRAEREYRKQVAAVRAEEGTRYQERDKQMDAAAARARVANERTLVASAYWWL